MSESTTTTQDEQQAEQVEAEVDAKTEQPEPKELTAEEKKAQAEQAKKEAAEAKKAEAEATKQRAAAIKATKTRFAAAAPVTIVPRVRVSFSDRKMSVPGVIEETEEDGPILVTNWGMKIVLADKDITAVEIQDVKTGRFEKVAA